MSSVNELLAEVTENQIARQCKADEDFSRLAHEIANGKNPTADRIDKILSTAGKSVDDLRVVVEGHLQRQADARTASLSNELATKREAITKQAEKNDAERDDALRKWDEANTQFAERLDQITAGESAAEQARQRLMKSAPAQLATEYRSVLDRKRELQNSIHRMRVDLSRRDSTIEEHKAKIAATTGGRHRSTRESHTVDELEQFGREIEEWSKLADTAEQELPKSEKQLNELERDEAALIERMLMP